MRFTRAWLFTVLAIAVPIGLMLTPFQLAASGEGNETSVGEAILLILIQWSFIGFSIAAFISTRPSGRWGRAIRRTSLYLAALIFMLLSVATIGGLLAGRWLMGLALLPMIPGALACFYAATRRDPQPMPADTKFTLRTFRPLAIGFGFFFSMTAAIFGILTVGDALHVELLARVLIRLPLVLFGLVFVAMIAGYIVKVVVRARGYDANAGICFYASLDKWKKLDDAEARGRWTNAFSVPLGGTLTQAWTFRGVDMTRIHCRDAAGEVYWLFDGPPKLLEPSLHWIAGLFLRAEWDEIGGKKRRSVRFFERLGCRWQPRTEEEAADDLERLGGERPPGHLGCWQCTDCGVIRLDFQSSDGRVLMVLRNIPREPEPAYYAGYFFTYAGTIYPRSAAWSKPRPGRPPRTTSNPPPTTQPS